jgi:hypothetical protein
MDIDRTSSWLAFYIARDRADNGDPNVDTVVGNTGGRHLFGSDSHMYRFWCSAEQQIQRPMVLVADNIDEIRNHQIDARIEWTGPIEEMVALKNGHETALVFYRVVYGYKGDSPVAPEE